MNIGAHLMSSEPFGPKGRLFAVSLGVVRSAERNTRLMHSLTVEVRRIRPKPRSPVAWLLAVVLAYEESPGSPAVDGPITRIDVSPRTAAPGPS